MSGPAAAQQAASPVMLTTIAAPLLALVNAYRASVGSPPVCIVAPLTAAAEAHSRDMAANQYFSHNNQNGTSPFNRMLAAGYSFNAAAENIAYGYVSPAAVMQGWIASPGHERNLRNAVYAHMGVGAAVAPCMGGQPGTCIWWTQDFGRSNGQIACVNVQGEPAASMTSAVVATSRSSVVTRTTTSAAPTLSTTSMTASTVPTLSTVTTATAVIVGSEVPAPTTGTALTTRVTAVPTVTSNPGPTPTSEFVLTTIVEVGSTSVATRTSRSTTTRQASTSTRTTTASRSSTTTRRTTTTVRRITRTRRVPTPTRVTPVPRSTTAFRVPARTATTTRDGGGVAELPTEPCDYAR
ncbi:hypothetical protein AMAG_04453 [Allomyces macrogynus ATCC 38327]|uniref:SCP domain-containing protein n=1 Tax=Allomyces macrogynus (strain ATCC 38327) TaxID=578462 RepID=A0A0L0S8X3_ALLM3|nr:hypothetical protein AMAG_04453 [Allomyces macrogynus ATCC 38327]|eukprot:KNE58917.1 hypothetical protein AMAG_04453 [Allomyces macrogynus ATCC 38327]